MRTLICLSMTVVFCVTAFAASSPVSAAPDQVHSTHLLSKDTVSGCDPSYPEGFFRACYYEGTDPYQGNWIRTEEESPLGSPVADRTFGIDHDWGTGAIQNISAIWRGRLYFNAGRYQFTTFARDGVRLFIDEQLLIDQWIPDEFWYRFGSVVELTEGFHDIRVEWFAAGQTTGSTLLRLHWDRVPAPPGTARQSPMVIDVFLLEKQDTCIVGNRWLSGEPVAIYEPDGSIYRAWQQEADLPRTLPASDPSLGNYDQVECFSFSYPAEEIPSVLKEVEGFEELIRNWSGGDLQPEVRVHPLEGEVKLGRIGNSWIISPRDIAPLAEHFMTTESDFAIVLSSNDDITTGRYFLPFGCGATYGVDQVGVQPLGGTGYSWITCVDSLTILHEWEHQFTAAMRYLLQFESIYMNDDRFPERAYPPCGTGDVDIFKWFPDSEDWGRDPDSPWCGMYDSPSTVGIAELHLFAHYDGSLAHYPLGFFTGNHCNDGILDLGETEVDKGANCPAKAPQASVEKQPSDDAWIQVRSSRNYGDDKQLKLRKDSRVAFLKFDLQDVQGDVTNAQLILTAVRTQVATAELYAVTDTDWQEETLTGKNAPSFGERLDSVVISAKKDKKIRWDVTAFLNEAIANGAEEVSFALVLADGKQVAFFSKESEDSANAPVLSILSEPDSNLLLNGGFESGSTQLPANWGTETLRGSASFTWDGSVRYSGSRSAKIETLLEPAIARWHQSIQVEPDSEYELAGWVRTLDVEPGRGARIAVYGMDSFLAASTSPRTGTTEWTYVSIRFITGKTNLAKVTCTMGEADPLYVREASAGTMWCDDLTLTKLRTLGRTQLSGEHMAIDLYTEDYNVFDDPVGYVSRLDEVYEAMAYLVGAVPFNGEMITVRSDASMYYFLLSGNPIRKDPGDWGTLVNKQGIDFGVVHELGHDFSTNIDYYMSRLDFAGSEHWANLKLMYAFDVIGTRYPEFTIDWWGKDIPLNQLGQRFVEVQAQPWIDSGRTDYRNMHHDVYTGLLYSLVQQVGWEPFAETFHDYNSLTIPVPTTDEAKVELFANLLSEHAGMDLIPTFQSWGFPIQRYDATSFGS